MYICLVVKNVMNNTYDTQSFVSKFVENEFGRKIHHTKLQGLDCHGVAETCDGEGVEGRERPRCNFRVN